MRSVFLVHLVCLHRMFVCVCRHVLLWDWIPAECIHLSGTGGHIRGVGGSDRSPVQGIRRCQTGRRLLGCGGRHRPHRVLPHSHQTRQISHLPEQKLFLRREEHSSYMEFSLFHQSF